MKPNTLSPQAQKFWMIIVAIGEVTKLALHTALFATCIKYLLA